MSDGEQYHADKATSVDTNYFISISHESFLKSVYEIKFPSICVWHHGTNPQTRNIHTSPLSVQKNTLRTGMTWAFDLEF